MTPIDPINTAPIIRVQYQDTLALMDWWPDIFKFGRPTVVRMGDRYVLVGKFPRATASIPVQDVPDHIRTILDRLDRGAHHG